MLRRIAMIVGALLIVAPINGTARIAAGKYVGQWGGGGLNCDWLLGVGQIGAITLCLAVLCVLAGLQRS